MTSSCLSTGQLPAMCPVTSEMSKYTPSSEAKQRDSMWTKAANAASESAIATRSAAELVSSLPQYNNTHVSVTNRSSDVFSMTTSDAADATISNDASDSSKQQSSEVSTVASDTSTVTSFSNVQHRCKTGPTETTTAHELKPKCSQRKKAVFADTAGKPLTTIKEFFSKVQPTSSSTSLVGRVMKCPDELHNLYATQNEVPAVCKSSVTQLLTNMGVSRMWCGNIPLSEKDIMSLLPGNKLFDNVSFLQIVPRMYTTKSVINIYSPNTALSRKCTRP